MGGSPSTNRDAQLTVAIAGFLEACGSPNTRAAYRTDLGHFAVWCRQSADLDLSEATVADVARYRAACELSGAAPATVARRLCAIASFGAYIRDAGIGGALAASPALARPTVATESTAEVLEDDEARALLEGADRTSDRCAVLVRLLMLDGLKVGEVVRADTTDVAGRPPCMRLTVHDRASRTVALHPGTAAAVRRYLGRRRDGPLLLSERRGREPERLTRFGIDFLIKQAARTVGLDRPVSGNTLRRRYVIAAHAGGMQLEDIRQSAGHADARTTRRYLPTGVRTGPKSR